MISKIELHIHTMLLLLAFLTNCSKDVSINTWPRMEITCATEDWQLDKKDTACIIRFTETVSKIIYDEHAVVRLRGNSTAEFPKLPFNIKFSQSVSLCGMPEAKKWVLLANYFDKTMIRNALAFKMSEDSRLEWTPHYCFVELYYNNIYKGIYQLCEKVEVHRNRVNAEQGAWLLEIDNRVTDEDIQFRTPHMENPYRIDWPHKNITSEQVMQIRTFLLEAEETLFGDNFTDPVKGWRKYLDEASWVDWYLINEITKNCDGNFYSSCYMHLNRQGKIAMGPIWDYDTCFGNCIWEDPRNPKGFYVRNAQWITRLIEDPAFVQNVHERFRFFYDNRFSYYDFVFETALRLRPLVERNDSVWHTIGAQISPFLFPYATYNEDVEYLTSWLQTRFEWLKDAL